MPAYEEIRADTAAEFWKLLSPENPVFGRGRETIYRGQSNATWPLTPSIFRDSSFSSRTCDQITHDEWALISEFLKNCDKIDTRIPNDSILFRRSINNGSNIFRESMFDPEIWPPKEIYEVLALAQHFGLHTRLLDWSTRSYVAAYFAISGNLHDNRSDHIAVWALDISAISNMGKWLEVVKVPGSNNINVAAQSGVFTLQRYR
ncbi:FRG domain-containing protein [Nitrospirillum sp. BR 11752]|uniref:FRG domain-containing protein n=1 Tax=Nitrospirillum sp. BR 11752 TaxID=3104293 RepID=UPI002ECB06D6|nr:FRG domain-containing protein [Nitrospirillum sp. BR 11752]